MASSPMSTVADHIGERALYIRIDRRESVPLYTQIATGLRALVEAGQLPAATLLPPERVLCERYGISRMTLRQAFAELERDGLLESHRGRGTFVATRPVEKQQQELRSFSEEARARGAVPSSRLISLQLVTPRPDDVRFFGLGPGERCYELKRVRLADGVPLALETVRLPERLCPGLDKTRIAKGSLYSILESSYGIVIERSIEEVSAIRPSSEHRKLLRLPATVAMLQIRRRTFASNGAPVEVAVSAFRGDRFTAVVRSVRSPASRR
jgi:GntR family transcriptional regulator